ncbi:hypothetical protein KX935_08185 [Streptobacillus moniliformis]|nr:hypothetical protein KX935_08185 [Streptobacillus moniliformis]
MNHKVYDSLDNPHARKNLYLKDVADGITTNKNSHSYIVEMKKLLEEEKIYLSALNKLKFTEKKELLSKFDEKEAKLRIELFEAEKLNLFYAGKEEKSYDFELESKKSAIKIDRLPSIIKLYSESIKEKKELQLKLSTLSRHDEEEKIKEFESKKQDLKNIFKSEVDKLKNSHSEGLISGKALRTQISQLKMELKDKLEVLKLDIPSEGIKSRINVLNYLSTVEVKSRYKIMQQDIADLYRKIPVEIESINKTPALLSLLFPGFGQYHNKQYFKAALFFIGLLFIYFVAIPYTLGYGNYRGEGIRGLISLAKNGKKLDKSIIFMIEGIISIILILFTITISYLSFKDAKDVMVAKLKGIRPKTTFETIESLKEEGFLI